jgi:hypothetical protein
MMNCKWCKCNACLHFYPHILKEGYEGCNHIAISQRALLYQYLPHQSGYGFVHMHKNMRMQRLQCMNFIYIIILNFRGKATRGTKCSDIKVNSGLSCWCEVLKLNGDNSNNKVKACSSSLRLLAFTENKNVS